MNSIKYLLDWRLDNFLKEYNIDLDDFDQSKDLDLRLQAFKNIAKQLVPRTSCNDIERKKYINYGLWLIKSAIWKNITSYTFTVDTNSDKCNLYITRIYSNHRETFVPNNSTFMDRNMLLNKCNFFSNDNLNKLWYLIISYFMLIDAIIILSDLSNVVKELIYNIMLIKN